MSDLQALTLQDTALPSVQVSATVVMSILSSYQRRSQADGRVIGTLLGEVKDNGDVVVTECFAVPFAERTEELYVAINQDYHKQMYAFHRRNNKRERIVGWYTTTAESGQLINDNSSLIHDFYTSEYQQQAAGNDSPVHLVVDTALGSDSLDIRGFVCTPTIVGGEVLAKTFQELQVELQLSDAEATCLSQMIHATPVSAETDSSVILSELPSAQQKVESSMEELQRVLADIQGYVDSVLEGKISPSREVGIAIADALNSFAAMQLQQQKQASAAGGSEASQGGALNTRLQDLLMVSYLTTLTQTQALVSQKLNEVL